MCDYYYDEDENYEYNWWITDPKDMKWDEPEGHRDSSTVQDSPVQAT